MRRAGTLFFGELKKREEPYKKLAEVVDSYRARQVELGLDGLSFRFALLRALLAFLPDPEGHYVDYRQFVEKWWQDPDGEETRKLRRRLAEGRSTGPGGLSAPWYYLADLVAGFAPRPPSGLLKRVEGRLQVVGEPMLLLRQDYRERDAICFVKALVGHRCYDGEGLDLSAENLGRVEQDIHAAFALIASE